jgi:flagellar biosynthesis anti-sigma factor FlgM
MKIERDPSLGAVGGPPAQAGAPVAAQRRTEVGGHGGPADLAAATDPKPAAKVELSARSRELHEALRVANAAHDVRPDLVTRIKTQVDNGTYIVDPHAIASGMLDRRA